MIYEYARTDMPISFPGLFGEWSVNPDPIAVHIGNGIHWYGIIICTGLILAVLLLQAGQKVRHHRGQRLRHDDLADTALYYRCEIILCDILF